MQKGTEWRQAPKKTRGGRDREAGGQAHPGEQNAPAAGSIARAMTQELSKGADCEPNTRPANVPSAAPVRGAPGASWGLIPGGGRSRRPRRGAWRLPLRNTVGKGKRNRAEQRQDPDKRVSGVDSHVSCNEPVEKQAWMAQDWMLEQLWEEAVQGEGGHRWGGSPRTGGEEEEREQVREFRPDEQGCQSRVEGL